jgi:hypothetical protein
MHAFQLIARQYGGPSVKSRSRLLGIGIARSQPQGGPVIRREHRKGFNSVQMRALPDEAERRRVSGCRNHYQFVSVAGAKVEDPPTGEDEPQRSGARRS